MNLNITPRSIYFSRHGESIFNVQGKIGGSFMIKVKLGDSMLSPRGVEFSNQLPAVIKSLIGQDHLTIWTSSLRRTIQTASTLSKDYNTIQLKQLDEIDSGVCDGLSYDAIEKLYPSDYLERESNKFNYRYHGGILFIFER
jgi:6-phosphofructo-2-kinase/fructose-2,6-biphosphatase 2